MSKYTQTNSSSAQSISEGIPRMLSSPSPAVSMVFCQWLPLAQRWRCHSCSSYQYIRSPPTLALNDTSTLQSARAPLTSYTVQIRGSDTPTLRHSGTCRMSYQIYHSRTHLLDVKHLGQDSQQWIINQTKLLNCLYDYLKSPLNANLEVLKHPSTFLRLLLGWVLACWRWLA